MTRWPGQVSCAVVALLWCVSFCDDACALQAPAEPKPAMRGVSASVKYDGSQGGVRAKPDQPASSPVFVRAAAPDAQGRQTIEFVGVIAGDFDLREYLVKDDGTSLPESFSLPVRIVSNLPAGLGSDVAGIERSAPQLKHSYVAIVTAIGIVWLAIPIIVLVHRALRRRVTAAPVHVETQPTLSDEIRSLLSAAKSQPLSIAQRGRLELLIMQFLQQQRGIAPSSEVTPAQLAAGLRELRSDSQTRELVLAIEAWLHQRPEHESEVQRAQQASAALDSFQQHSLGAPKPASQGARS